jgi:hypothetical protein
MHAAIIYFTDFKSKGQNVALKVSLLHGVAGELLFCQLQGVQHCHMGPRRSCDGRDEVFGKHSQGDYRNTLDWEFGRRCAQV